MRGPTLRLVCVNDVYSLENLPRLRTLVRHHRETDPADLLITTLAGDFVAPSLLSSLDHGDAMVACLNAVPVTHVCFGNHEQDVPPEALVARVKQFQGTWLNTNVRGFEPTLPSSQVLEVRSPSGRTVRVGLVGVVTEDPSLYHPGAFQGCAMGDANETALAVGRGLVGEQGCACVIALTHQSLDRDEALARRQGDPPIPLIVAGHEHVAHIEQVGASWVVKAGTDAVYAAIVDLVWPAEAPAGEPDLPRVSVRLEPLADHADDPAMRALVTSRMRPVKALLEATLVRLGPGERLSSVGSRMQQTSLGAMFASRVRETLGADLCMLNGGGIRGAKTYETEFTWGDLEAELPFANEVVIVSMPGAVLRDAIVASRARAPQPAPGFLQLDDGAEVDAAHRLTRVGGAPFDAARDYRVATVRVLFDGMDHVEPLVRFAKSSPERVPPRDAGRELTMILVESFAMSLWRSIAPFEAIDTDHDLTVSADELRAAIARATHRAPVELLVDGILRALDTDHDGRISRDEAARRG